MAALFGVQVAIALILKAKGRITRAEPRRRRDISTMSWSGRLQYAWEVVAGPGQPGYYFRGVLGLWLGWIAAVKISGDGTGDLILGLVIAPIAAAAATVTRDG